MNLDQLTNNVVEETIPLRGGGEPLVLGLMPNVYTSEDSDELDLEDTVSICNYILKGVNHWNIRPAADEPVLEVSLQNVMSLPESLQIVIVTRINSLKESLSVKKTTRKK